MEHIDEITNWFARNKSDIFSISGIFLTVLFSWKAKRSADSAADAAKNTRLHIAKISSTGVFQECVFIGELARGKIDAGHWDEVHINLIDVRKKLVTLVSSSEYTKSKEDQIILTEILVQIRLLVNAINKIRHNKIKSPSKVNLLKILNEQLDAIHALHETAKASLGEIK